jgi:hypothetical protein
VPIWLFSYLVDHTIRDGQYRVILFGVDVVVAASFLSFPIFFVYLGVVSIARSAFFFFSFLKNKLFQFLD